MKTTICRTFSLVTSSALLFGAGNAFAENVRTTHAYCSPDGTTGGFKPTDVLTANGGTLKLKGAATITADGKLKLTDRTIPESQDSNVYFHEPLDFSYVDQAQSINRPFHVYFSFKIGPNDGANGGAGLAFLMQNDEAGKSGASGSSLGYGGISTSLAIEFDTHKDTPPAGNATYPDPQQHHIGFMLDGENEEHPAWILQPETLTNALFHVWIDYGANQEMQLYMSKDGHKPQMPLGWTFNKSPVPQGPNATYPDDFDADYWFSVMGAGKLPQAWVGFSAATYSAMTNDHVIEEWEFSNVGIPCACQEVDYCGTVDPTTPVCAPDTGLCVECNVDKDCPLANPSCNVTTHSCGPCMEDADCRDEQAPHCAMSGPKQDQCVECIEAADCKSDKPVCDAATNICIVCTKHDDCKLHETTPYCILAEDSPSKGTCTPDPCGPCPSNTLCNYSTAECVPPTACPECPDGSVCDLASGQCVTEDVCKASGTCPPTCSSDTDCVAPLMCNSATNHCDVGTIEGSGCACTAAGSTTSDGMRTLLPFLFGAAAIVARRRRRA